VADQSEPDRHSALRDAVEVIGDRWKLLIVASLLEGPQRFGELERQIDGIAPTVLSARLRALEADGLVIARPYCERPPRYTYELTESARALAPALDLLTVWGAGGPGAESPLHHACGTPLEAGWFCSTCERPVAAGEVEELDFV
jgi:DNA-binding HxlR family transcriptional regulator